MTPTDRTALRTVVDEGNESAGDLLTELAGERADLATLEYLIEIGVESATDKRAEIAAEQGDAVTLQRLAGEGSKVAETLLSRVIRESQ